MNDSKKRETLNVKDLMRLFGKQRSTLLERTDTDILLAGDVGEDGEGRPFIFAQGADRFDEGEPAHLRLAPDEDDEDAFMGNEE